jgi:hypothetical protein
MTELEQKEVRRLRRADPRLAAAIDKRYEHWPESMRSAMLLAIAQAERTIERHHFKETLDAQQ